VIAPTRLPVSVKLDTYAKLEAIRAELVGARVIPVTTSWSDVIAWLCDHRPEVVPSERG
jgi:hypothetical protein